MLPRLGVANPHSRCVNEFGGAYAIDRDQDKSL